MTNTLKLTNGITEIDLLSGDTRLLENGLRMGIAPVTAQMIASPFRDGDELAWYRYGNRHLQGSLRVQASSLANMRTDVRALEQFLADAAYQQRQPYKNQLPNLLVDGSFEIVGLGDWTASNATLSRVTTPTPLDGWSEAKILANCAADTSVVYQVWTFALGSTCAGKTVTLGAWVQAASGNNRIQDMSLDDGTVTHYGTIPKDDTWHWITITKAVASNAIQLNSYFWVCYAATTDSDDILYVDGARLVEGSYCPPSSTPLTSGRSYLLQQWGNTETDHTYYELVRGDVSLPAELWSWPGLLGRNIWPVSIDLETKPFGMGMTKTLALGSLGNNQAVREIAKSVAVQNTVYSIYGGGAGGLWEGETYTTTTAQTVRGVAALCYGVGTIGNITAGIYTTAAGVPTALELVTKTLDGTRLSSWGGTDYGYFEWLFDTPLALANATMYATVLSFPGGTIGNALKWRANNIGAAGGRVYSTDGGASWTADGTKDFAWAWIQDIVAPVVNYQDSTTECDTLDVPAKMYQTLIATGATGSKKIWTGKRSGRYRYNEDLWLEGENWTSYTKVAASAGKVAVQLDTAASNDEVAEAQAAPTGVVDEIIHHIDYTLTNPPRGQFRVLVRAKWRETAGNQLILPYLGVGYSYGGGASVKAPSWAAGEIFGFAAHNTWQIVDLGVIWIPPFAESEIAVDSAYTLRLYTYAKGTNVPQVQALHWDIDYLMLMPLDEGACFVTSVASTNVLAFDSVSLPSNVFTLTSTDSIAGYPAFVGKPFMLGREWTRLYVLRDDVPAVTFESKVKYQPTFKTI